MKLYLLRSPDIVLVTWFPCIQPSLTLEDAFHQCGHVLDDLVGGLACLVHRSHLDVRAVGAAQRSRSHKVQMYFRQPGYRIKHMVLGAPPRHIPRAVRDRRGDRPVLLVPARLPGRQRQP